MYAVGGFDFPASTGTYSVTGLGFQPQGVIMFGGNIATVGSLVTGQNGPGLFVSINATDYASPSTIRSMCLAPNGNSDAGVAAYRGYENGCISMQTNAASSATIDYRASTITFDSDGFTINVTHAAASRRPIHWVAWGGIHGGENTNTMNTGAAKQVMSGLSPTFNNSWRPLSAIVLSTVASNGFGEGSVDGSTWFSFGTGHYPLLSQSEQDWLGSTTYTQLQLGSPLGRQGFTQTTLWPGLSGNPALVNVSEVISALGPVLIEGYRRHRPNIGVDLTQMINEGGGGANTWQYGAWWDGEGWAGAVNLPDGGTQTVNRPSNFKVFEAVVFSTINGPVWQGGASSTAPMRVGFGVLGPNYQGCVVFGQDGSFYQSVDRCTALCNSGGISTASGVINGATFTLTSEDAGDIGNTTWHGWGRPGEAARWIPHIYRILTITGRGAFPPPVVISYLLLEDGTSRLALEDGSGFLSI